MSSTQTDDENPSPTAPSKSDELKTFLFLTVVVAPVAAVVGVGGYGFAVWMSQIIFGPPGG